MARRAIGIACVALVNLFPGAYGAAAASWTTGSVPVPRLAFGELSGVSCRSASWCVAVGSVPDTAYAGAIQRPLIELWDGVHWLAEASPDPVGARRAVLAAVSCVSVRVCLAVGSLTDIRGSHQALVERWNGGSWTVASGPQGSGLSGVSCASARSCAAVGGATLARWNGHRWSSRRASRGAAFAAVSCSSTKMCVAVGSARRKTLAASTTESGWSIEGTPNPVAENFGPSTYTIDALSGISCGSSTNCVAVGSAYSSCNYDVCGNDSASGGLALRWNGQRWTIAPHPHFADGARAISCASRRACFALSDAGGSRWNGSVWTAVPGVGGAALSAVSCPSVKACEVVGFSSISYSADMTSDNAGQPTSSEVAFAAHLNGRALVSDPTSTRLARPARAVLASVSCATVSDCMAVGSYELGPGAAGVQASLAEHWDGSAWTLEPAAGAELIGVSCPSSGDCTAVGDSCGDFYCARPPLIERWDGVRWATASAPEPAGASWIHMNAISCARPVSCTAVGTYGTATSDFLPLVEHWNGLQWAVEQAPSPTITYNGGGGLDAVSCPTATFCVATGSGNRESEIWDGTHWTLKGWQAPGDAAAVSCATATACVAVGDVVNGSEGPWASAWNGTAWIPETPPRISPGYDGDAINELNAVSCASASACLAVGAPPWRWAFANSRADFWDGSSWTAVALPQSGHSPTFFHAVSCPSPTACTAVSEGTVDNGPVVGRYLVSASS